MDNDEDWLWEFIPDGRLGSGIKGQCGNINVDGQGTCAIHGGGQGGCKHGHGCVLGCGCDGSCDGGRNGRQLSPGKHG